MNDDQARQLADTFAAHPQPAAPSYSTVTTVTLTGNVLRCDYPLSNTKFGPTSRITGERTADGQWHLKFKKAELGTLPTSGAITRVLPTEVITRETPGWAKVLGVIGFFFFLIGALFFLVKEDRRMPGSIIEVTGTDGRVFAFQVGEDPMRLRYGIGAQ